MSKMVHIQNYEFKLSSFHVELETKQTIEVLLVYINCWIYGQIL